MKYKLKRGLSLLLSCALILSLLPAAALAADPEDQVTGGVNGYMAALTADADTSDEYKTAFTAESGTTIDNVIRSETLNGKLWADKTVSVSEDANGNQTGAFDVTLSALGQTFSSTETTESQVAYDVMLVLDFSGSMTEADVSSGNSTITRTAAMVNAVNAAIKSLMIDENGDATNNRVGIVAFSGSSIYTPGSGNIYNFLPLDHYTTSDSDGDYLEVITTTTSELVRAIRTGNYGRYTYYVKDSSNQNVTASEAVGGGTPTQGGIFYAGSLLSAGASSTTGVTNTSQVRIPTIILMTDGNPGRATNAYTTMATSGNGVTTYTGEAGNGKASYNDDVAAYTMLTANYVKTNVASTYWNKYSDQYATIANLSQDNLVKFYTIGLGITDGSWGNFMLNPGMDVSSSSDSTISAIQTILTADSTYGAAYNYTDGYWGGSISDDDLTKIFQTALSGAKITGAAVNVGESSGGRDKTTFYDTLGDGIVLGGDGTMTLTVPTCEVDETNDSFVADAARVYTLTPYDADDSELASAAAVEAYLTSGGTVTYKATAVAVGGGQAGSLGTSNSYDKSASEELSVTLQIPAATGRHQIRAAIPSTLMAYNILSSDTNTEGMTTYSYFSSEPIRLSYAAQAASATEAGEYYAGALGRTYLTFAPSSAQNEEGAYEMPYYWEGRGNQAGDYLAKDPNTTGSDEYVYKTDWTDNNLVYIYLGNNGKLTLSGKDLTFTIHWDDNSNVDNVRPEEMAVSLYRVAVSSEQAGAAANKDTFDPNALTALTGKEYNPTLTVANVPGTDTNVWQYVFPNLPVYGAYTDANRDTQNGYFRYWLVFDEGSVTEAKNVGYSAALYKFDDGSVNGQELTYGSGDSSRTWFCFTAENDDSTDRTGDQALDVGLSRKQDTVTYTITKQWDPDIKDIPASIQIQMYANGQPVDGNGESVSAGSGLVTLYGEVPADGAPDYATDAWKAKLTLPKNSAGGNAIQYTPVEVTAGYTVTVEYGTVTDSNHSITGYTAELSNYPDATTTSLNVTKIWDDNNDQDGKRPESVSFKLTATKAGEAAQMTDEALVELLGLTAENGKTSADLLTKTLGTDGTVAWTDLPKTDGPNASGTAVTYGAMEVETRADGTKTAIEENGTTSDGYKVTYDADTVPGYLFVTNSYIPETVDITISKTWEDSDNQDGLRPANGAFNGRLWKQVGESGKPEIVRSWASTTGADVTITGLPRYENGTEIIYYVSEIAVNGYSLSTNSTGDTKSSGGVTLYPVTITTDGAGKITLTNTHEASLTEYTVDFTWQDEDVSLRPDTITLTLTRTVEDGKTETNSTYDITLTVGDHGTINYASAADGVTLPEGVALSIVTDSETGVSTLTISNLAVYSDGTLITYSVGVKNSGEYASTLTDYTLISDSFTLTYAPETIDLVLTKEWSDGYPSEYKPAFGVNALGLELYAGDTKLNDQPDNVTVGTNGSWVFTWKDVLKYESGTGYAIVYKVKESAAPTANADGANEATFNTDGKATLTNTFDPDSQANQISVTVTKVWTDNSDAQGLRPKSDSDAAENMITLYKENDTDKTSVGTLTIKNNEDDTWTYAWTGVPKYDAEGNQIAYVVEETNVPDGYSVTNSIVTVTYNAAGNGVTEDSIINTLKSDAYTSGYLTVTKTWEDQNNLDGSRPESVTFDIRGLKSDAVDATSTTASSTLIDVEVKTGTDGKPSITATNRTNASLAPTDVKLTYNGTTVTGFQFTIALPINSLIDGSALTYYVVETVPAGYAATYKNANGEAVSFENRVSLGESKDSAAAITVTNSYTPNTYTVTYDGNSSSAVDVPTDTNQYVSGTTATISTGVPASDGLIFAGWTLTQYSTVTSQGAYDLIASTIKKSGDTLTITGDATLYAVWLVDSNKNDTPDYQETTEGLTFVWEDESNRDGVRPTELTVNLTVTNADGTKTTATVTANPADNTGTTELNGDTWVYTYPITAGTTIKIDSVSGTDGNQTAVISGTSDSGYGYSIDSTERTTVTLTYSPKKDKSVTVTKTWADMENVPDGWTNITATIALYANDTPITDAGGEVMTKTVTYAASADTSTVTWSDLYVNENGEPITYTAVETAIAATVDNTEQDVTGRFKTAYSSDKLTITNTFAVAEEETTSFTFMQLWNDENNTAQMRPNSITVTLEADDKKLDSVTVEPDANGSWGYTWDDLPLLKSGADPENLSETDYIVYQISGITMNFSDAKFDNLYTDTQTLAISNVEVWTAALNKTGEGADAYYRSIEVSKLWSDRDDALNLRPGSVAIVLKANGSVVRTAILNAESEWKATFADLPVYQSFTAITYTVEEYNVPAEYVVTYNPDDGVVGTNSSVTITNTYQSAGSYTVTYDGNGNTGGTAPEDAKKYDEFNTTATVLGNTGSLTKTDAIFLGWSTVKYPVIKTSAEENLIDILEADEALTVSENTTLYAVWAADTNGNDTPDYKEENVNLTFIWEDQNDYDRLRPPTVTVTLEDGTQVTVGLGSVNVTGNTWATENGYLSGTKIESVTAPEGYTAAIEGDGISVTLTHAPGTTTFALEKTWVDMDLAPDDWEDVTATFVLYGNGKRLGNEEQTAVYSGADDTAVKWANLDQYEDGVEITYHAYETKVTAKINGESKDVTNYFQIAYDLDSKTNTYAEQVTNTFLANAGKQQRAFTYVLEWDDNNNAAGMRPSSVTVQLTDQNGNVVGDPITISKTENWSTTWYGLDTYQPTGGAYAEYSVTVRSVTYTKADGTDVSGDFDGLYILKGSDKFDENGAYVNTQIDTWKIVTLDPGTDDPDLKFSRTLSVTKEWIGDDQTIGSRPDGVTVQLLGDNALMQSLVLNENESWAAEVTVPKYQNFEEIDYSVQEANPSDLYTVTYAEDDDTFTVTNTLTAQAHTITFVYENAYATDSTGAKIAENEAITVSAGGTYVFTTYAEDGYLLSGSAVLAPSGSAELTVTGGNTYQVSDLTDDVTITIRAAADRPDMIRVDYVGNNPSSEIFYTTYVESGEAAPTDVSVTYSGYTFLGWYTADGVQYIGAPVTEALTLYAKWEKTGSPVEPDYKYGLTVTKKLSEVNGTDYRSGSVSVGDRLTYTITVKNTGDYRLTDITVTDVLPDGVELLDATGDYEYSGRSGEVSWTIDSLEIGTFETFTVTVVVLEKAAGSSLHNTAVANSQNADNKTTITVKVDGTNDSGEAKKPTLNTDDHVAYIIGYEDGTVRPKNNITRAEVATIFFRLLTDESRELYWGKTNSFSDVSAGDWFNNAVSTMSNAGIISGYPDGTFRPNAPITRAEFATIAARFSEVIYNGGNSFTDVPEDHWAARYIALAEYLGWIKGYEDGTFRPDQSITRAEAMTLINRVLERAVEEEHMLPDMVTWSDNVPGAWYYEAVQEATNSHEYTRLNKKVAGQSFYYEDWREILKTPDWAALERAWSTANSK